MKKSTFFSILVIFLLIPLTLYLGTRVKGRWYYLISTMIIIELMLPFFFRFEARRPQARELVILTVMAALAAVSRVAFSFSPFLKTITGIIMITGIAFGRGRPGRCLPTATGSSSPGWYFTITATGQSPGCWPPLAFSPFY